MKHIFMFAAVLCTAVPAAHAQGSDDPERANSERFAKCVVGHDAGSIRRGLVENWTPEKFMVEMKGPHADACTRGSPQLQMRSPDLRYVLALEVLDASGLLKKPLNVSTVPPLTHKPVHAPTNLAPGETAESANAQQAALDHKDMVFFAVGECVVRADAEKVRQVLADRANAGAINSIVPLLSGCTPANTQLRFSPAALRGLIGLSYLRLADAAEKAPAPAAEAAQ